MRTIGKARRTSNKLFEAIMNLPKPITEEEKLFAQRIRNAREAKGYSTAVVAECCGFSQSLLSYTENYSRRLNAEHRRLVCQFLNVRNIDET